jgi:hypothetical protein
MQTILSQQYQLNVSAAEVISALGLPAGTQITGADWNVTNTNELTISAIANQGTTGTPATIQVITSEIGEFVFSLTNALTALGLPSTATISSASWNFNGQQLEIIATNPISTTGTP